jgi:hypothetical protein
VKGEGRRGGGGRSFERAMLYLSLSWWNTKPRKENILKEVHAFLLPSYLAPTLLPLICHITFFANKTKKTTEKSVGLFQNIFLLIHPFAVSFKYEIYIFIFQSKYILNIPKLCMLS